MAIKEVMSATQQRLLTIVPPLPTAYENQEFTPPSTMYQKVRFMIMRPDDPTWFVGYHRENIQLQVYIVGVTNEGTSDILERASLVREKFAKATYLTTTNPKVTAHVLRTPQISSTTTAENRPVAVVLIDLLVEVYS